MPRKNKVGPTTVVLLLGLAVGASGQEVNSDVKIPPPRVTMAAAPALNGFFVGPDSRFTGTGQGVEFRGAASEAVRGLLSEDETRDRLGDFVTSLLIREGVLSFDGPSTVRANSSKQPEDGSRPAWAGPTPTALSVSRTSATRRR